MSKINAPKLSVPGQGSLVDLEPQDSKYRIIESLNQHCQVQYLTFTN